MEKFCNYFLYTSALFKFYSKHMVNFHSHKKRLFKSAYTIFYIHYDNNCIFSVKNKKIKPDTFFLNHGYNYLFSSISLFFCFPNFLWWMYMIIVMLRTFIGKGLFGRWVKKATRNHQVGCYFKCSWAIETSHTYCQVHLAFTPTSVTQRTEKGLFLTQPHPTVFLNPAGA